MANHCYQHHQPARYLGHLLPEKCERWGSMEKTPIFELEAVQIDEDEYINLHNNCISVGVV